MNQIVTKSARLGTRTRLTRRVVESIESGRLKCRRRIWDTELPGFYLLTTAAGYAGYYVRYTKLDGLKGDYSLGAAKLVTPESARAAARSVLADLILNGVDPVERRKARREEAYRRRLNTFERVVEQFWHDVELPEKTRADWESVLRAHLLPRFGKRPISSITTEEVKSAISEIQVSIAERRKGYRKSADGRRQANVCQDVLKRIFNHAISELKLCSDNPARFKRLFSDKARKRENPNQALNYERLAAIWGGLDAVPRGSLWEARAIGCKLHLLTLQRPCDILRAKAGDFNWDACEWRPRAEATKTGQEYFVPLSPEAVRLFKRLFEISGSDWAFPSHCRANDSAAKDILYRAFKRVRADLFASGNVDTDDIDLYDGRRFGRTLIHHQLGFGKQVAERVINHTPGSDISDLYDVYNYAEKVRAAQLAWSAEVMRIVAGHPTSPSASSDACPVEGAAK